MKGNGDFWVIAFQVGGCYLFGINKTDFGKGFQGRMIPELSLQNGLHDPTGVLEGGIKNMSKMQM